jgi:arsenate reductase/ArsR family transcriptional regulator
MNEVIAIAKALSDPARVRLLLALSTGELCLCHCVSLLEFAPSTVSRHLDVLYRAGLIERRKEGRWCYFRLAGRASPPAVREALRWVRTSVGESPEIVADTRRVAKLRTADRADVACCYKEC